MTLKLIAALLASCIVTVTHAAGDVTTNPVRIAPAAGIPPPSMMPVKPRIKPLPPEQWTEEQKKVCEPIATATGAYNILGIFVQHWEAFKARREWSAHLLGPGSTIPPRFRELLILRTAFVTPAEYEWAQHKPMARKAGLSDDEIERIKSGGSAPGWTATESALLDMTDDLIRQHTVSDSVWKRLTENLSTQQVFDAISTVGQYLSIALLANSVGVEIDHGLSGFDPAKVH